MKKIELILSFFMKKLSGMYLFQISNYIFPLVLIPILIKKTSLDGYGEIVYITALIQLLGTIIDYGFTYTSPVEVTRIKNRKNKLGDYYIKITILKIIIYLILMAALCFLKQTLNLNNTTILTISIILLGNVFFPIWLFQGLSLFNQVSAIQIITKVAFFVILISSIYLLDLQNKIYIIFLMSGNLIISFLLSIKYISKLIIIRKITLSLIKESIHDLKVASNVFISVLGSIGYNGLIPIILGKYLGSSSLAIYSILQKMTIACQSMILPVSQFMLTNISLDINSQWGFKKKISQSIKLHLVLSITGAICYILLGQFVSNMLGHKVELNLIILSSIIPIFSSVNNVLGIQTMIPLKKTSILRVINLSSGVIIALISVYIIKEMGIPGGVLLNLLGEVLVFFLLVYWHARNSYD